MLDNANVSRRVALAAFALAQEEDISHSETDSMSEMVYGEFLEVIGRLAAAKFPETDSTLAQTVDKIFQHSALKLTYVEAHAVVLTVFPSGRNAQQRILQKKLEELKQKEAVEEQKQKERAEAAKMVRSRPSSSMLSPAAAGGAASARGAAAGGQTSARQAAVPTLTSARSPRKA